MNGMAMTCSIFKLTKLGVVCFPRKAVRRKYLLLPRVWFMFVQIGDILDYVACTYCLPLGEYKLSNNARFNDGYLFPSLKKTSSANQCDFFPGKLLLAPTTLCDK